MFAGGFDCWYEVTFKARFYDISTNSRLRRKVFQGPGIMLGHDQNFSIWYLLVDAFRGLEPVQPRIDTSTNTMSGFSSMAFCTASVPSTARPQTIHPERASKVEHKPFLIFSLSSATKIRKRLGHGIGLHYQVYLGELNRPANCTSQCIRSAGPPKLCFSVNRRINPTAGPTQRY